MNFTLKVWRQKNKNSEGKLVTYPVNDVSPDMSFLEMFDYLNEDLINKGEEPIAFDSDCREGICGTCSMWINGRAHGPVPGVTTCQLHVRSFKDGETIVVEPWRAKAFPVIKDLVVDRSSFDKVIAAGGFVSINTGGAQDGNDILISKEDAAEAFSASICIGCGACVAACKNSSAMLFVASKISHFAMLPQGKVEAQNRVQNMVAKMDEEGFGDCSNTYACEAQCPKNISVEKIAKMNREYLTAKLI